jgi:hypothetical protein
LDFLIEDDTGMVQNIKEDLLDFSVLRLRLGSGIGGRRSVEQSLIGVCEK